MSQITLLSIVISSLSLCINDLVLTGQPFTKIASDLVCINGSFYTINNGTQDYSPAGSSRVSSVAMAYLL